MKDWQGLVWHTLASLLVIVVYLMGCAPINLNTNTPALNSTRITLYSNFDPTLTVDFKAKYQINTKNSLAFFDFDKSEITSGNNADIYLDVGCGSACFNRVDEINGATAASWFGEARHIEPGYAGCLKALQDPKVDPWVSNVPGDYSCLRTNQGNIVQLFAVENHAAFNNAKFVFDYHLWYSGQIP